MSGILERLFPDAWDFGGPERQTASEQAAQIREELADRLDQPGKKLLENLCAAYIREANLEIKDAYMQGLYDGMDLMTAWHQRRGPS